MIIDPAEIIAVYVEIISAVAPICIVFWFCQFIARTILNAAFGGKFTLR